MTTLDHFDLLGLPAGKPGRDGAFPADSVFGKVAARLEVWRHAEKHEDKDDEDEEKPKARTVVPEAPKQARRRPR